MTDLRTAAQQVLEYMKSIGQMDMYPEDWAIVGRLEAALAQQAEPTGKDSLPVESVVAENATTQQQLEQTPPSDYRRGYWAGFAIGKREGRIEAEDEPAQQAEPSSIRELLTQAAAMAVAAERAGKYEGASWVADAVLEAAPQPQQAEPAQEPFALQCPTPKACREHCCQGDCIPRTTPPQRKPLPASEIVTMYDESPRGDSDMITFARAVEQAHGIKESP